MIPCGKKLAPHTNNVFNAGGGASAYPKRGGGVRERRDNAREGKRESEREYRASGKRKGERK